MTPPTRSPAKTPSGSTTPQESEARKRVVKACDRCRLKKIKCDGQLPCSRCQAENTVCRYGERKKSIERRIPPGYVDYLEDQQKLLVMALKKSRAQVASSNTTSTSAAASSVSDLSVHSILEELGVLSEFPSHRSDESGFHFEEDLEILRRQCEEEDPSEQVQFPIASSPESMNAMFPQEDITQESWYQRGTAQPGSSARMNALEQQQQQQRQQYAQSQNPQFQLHFPRTLPSQGISRLPGAQASAGMDWVTSGPQPTTLTAPQGFPQDISTVSPSDLTLPTSMNSFPLPDEETWQRWLNERRG